jgi:hypothetical protein
MSQLLILKSLLEPYQTERAEGNNGKYNKMRNIINKSLEELSLILEGNNSRSILK